MRNFVKSAAAALLFGILAACQPAYAQPLPDCISIELDKELVEADGLVEYLGVRNIPFTGIALVFYRTQTDDVIASPIEDGCVSVQTMQMGPYNPETDA